MTASIQTIKNTIDEICGIKDGFLEGVRVSYTVKEMYEKVRGSVYRTRPSGRFQINVHPAEYRRGIRDTIFRTKKADNSFSILDVKDAIVAQVNVRKIYQSSEANRISNQAAAEELREKFTFKNKYIGNYVLSNTGSFVAPSTIEGKVAVQINFGQVTPEVAEKILAFTQSLEG